MDVLFRIHKDSLSEKLTPRSQSLTSLLSETAAILMLGFTVCGRPGCTVPHCTVCNVHYWPGWLAVSGPGMGNRREGDCDPAARARSEIGDGRDDGDTQREVVRGEGTLTVLTGCPHRTINRETYIQKQGHGCREWHRLLLL